MAAVPESGMGGDPSRDRDTNRVERVAASYDSVAEKYAERFSGELDKRPLERALLAMIVELSREGRLADVGCGPGQTAKYLRSMHPDVTGLDISPGMIRVARRNVPEVEFEVGSMLALPVGDSAWHGAVAMYSLIHFTPDQRVVALRELSRVLVPGGALLAAVHIESSDARAGDRKWITSLLGAKVELEGFFIAPETLALEAETAGLEVEAVIEGGRCDNGELASRRGYLVARKP